MTTTGDKVRYVKRQGQTRKHHCHWPGCERQVPPAMWGCKTHWYALPATLRAKIWATFRPGQEATLTPSRDYVAAAANAHIRASTGFRGNVKRSGSTPAHDWMRYPEALEQTIERFRGVVIEQRDATDVIKRYDGADVLFYVDPPYIQSTRARYGAHRRYTVEMSDIEHGELLKVLCQVKGAVVLSGYAHPLYEKHLKSWRRIEIAARADGARARTEIVWLNPAADAAHP